VADSPYTIDFGAPPTKILRDLDAIDARLLKTDALIGRVKASFKTLGSDTSGIKTMAAALVGLDAELKSKVVDSKAAATALKGVGAGNSAVTALTDRLKVLEAQLAAVTAAAAAAKVAGAGVGAGGPAGAGTGKGGEKPLLGPKTLMFGMAGVGMGMKAAGAIKAAGGEQRTFFADAADEAKAFREDMRQIAVLDGKTEVNDEVIRRQLAFQKETGLNFGEAQDLRLEFGGAVAPGKARKDANGVPNITDATATDLEKQSAKFGLRYDLDMTTTGRMSGLLANYGKVPSAAHGVGIMAESAEQLNIYGVGPVKGMMAPMLGLAGSMMDEEGGRFRDFPSMSARFAATTVSTAGKAAVAANQIRQTNRALRKFGTDKPEGEFLRKAGVTARDTYEEALAKVAPLIAGPDGDQVLIKAGFGNEREREGLVKQSKMTQVVEQQLKDPRMRAANVEAISRNDAFGSTLIGKERGAANEQFASRIENGMQGERLRAGREAAIGRMSDPKQPGGQRLKAGAVQSVLDMGNAIFAGATGRTATGEEIRVDSEAIRGVIEGGKKAKVPVDVRAQFPDLAYSMDKSHPLDSDKLQRQYGQAYEAVTAAGGDPFGGNAKGAGQAAKQAAAALNNLGNALDNQARPPDRGGPAAGGGVVPGRR